MKRFHPILLALILLSIAQSSPGQESSLQNWQILLGFGKSHLSWGGTEQKVETRDLILRHETKQDRVRGEGWYLNRRSLLIEIPLHYLHRPDEPPITGLYFNSCWTFEANRHVQPFLLVGGGPAFTNAEIPGTSSRLKGVYQAAGGLRFPAGPLEMSMEFRFHHISNGGIKDPNDPINSGKFLFGLRLPL
jgi:lipid A 3-O-deacylase